MISGRIKVNYFAQILLILKAKFGDDSLLLIKRITTSKAPLRYHDFLNCFIIILYYSVAINFEGGKSIFVNIPYFHPNLDCVTLS